MFYERTFRVPVDYSMKQYEKIKYKNETRRYNKGSHVSIVMFSVLKGSVKWKKRGGVSGINR